MKINTIILYTASILMVSMIAYGCFRLYRWFNWEFAYKSGVEDTVTKMVKPECLKGVER